MGKMPATQFYVMDFMSDAAGLTASSCGVWIRCLCYLHRTNPRGEFTTTKQAWARKCSCTVREFEKFLEENTTEHIADIKNADNGMVTVVSRRMVRERNEREKANIRQKRFQEKRKSNATDEKLTPPSSSSSSSSSSINTLSEVSDAKFLPDSLPWILAEELADLILKNDPKAKVPPRDSHQWQVNWCAPMDALLRLDHREEGEVAAIIHWGQSDDFWKTNILSPSKLRVKFPQLYLKAKSEGAKLNLRRSK